MTSFLSLATVWYARFYHAEPAPVVGTTKCPGSLCLMLALPSPGKRAPFPARTLLLGHRSYRPIRQTYWALLSSGYSPRSRSLCRLLPAPAAPQVLPDVILRIFPQMPEPVPRRVPLSAFAWFLLSVFGLPLSSNGSALRFLPRTRFFAGELSRLQLFRYVQASEFACLPDRSHRCKLPCRAAEAFTSEPNMCCYLHMHRTCYPPDNRQLAERGLSPRKIRSLVGCSR